MPSDAQHEEKKVREALDLLRSVSRSRLYASIFRIWRAEVQTAVLRPVEAMNTAILGSSTEYLVKGYAL